MSRRLSLASLAGLILLAGYELYVDAKQTARMDRFMTAGPRFTAKDGQELCERVHALEERSYGYRDAGKTALDCEYGQRK